MIRQQHTIVVFEIQIQMPTSIPALMASHSLLIVVSMPSSFCFATVITNLFPRGTTVRIDNISTMHISMKPASQLLHYYYHHSQ